MPERQSQNLSAPNELGAAQLPEASSMLADRFHRNHAVARDRFAEKPLLATSKGPTVTSLV